MTTKAVYTNGKIHIFPDRTELVKRDWQEKQVWYPDELRVQVGDVMVPVQQLAELYRKHRGWSYNDKIIAEIDSYRP